MKKQKSVENFQTSLPKKKSFDDRYIFKMKSIFGSLSKTKKKSSYRKYLQKNIFLKNQLQIVNTYTMKKATLQNKKNIDKLKYLRKNCIEPSKKFNIPGWKDNFYSNLLDWSFNNYLFAGYQNQLCIHNMILDQQLQEQQNLIRIRGQDLTSIKCSPYQTKICLGFSKDAMKIYDYQKKKIFFQDKSHIGRISTIQWVQNIIITGCKDQKIRFFDIRKNKSIKMSYEITNSHVQQVCGIKKYQNYLASGGNDNKVYIYDIRKEKVLDNYSHNAAVKALEWTNKKSLITGGGTADKKIKLWDYTHKLYYQIQTGSQVCNICWSQNTQQIISCQGFSLNQIIIWSEFGQRIFTFHGHSSRVLYSVLNPNGQYLATGAGDRTLKIWKLFKAKENNQLLNMQKLR